MVNSVSKSSDFKLPRISLHVTHRCNLKCKLCVVDVPYQVKQWHPNIEYLERTVDKIFELTPEVGRLVVSGGEPFLRKDLPEILLYIKKYLSRITRHVEIITNGSIPLNPRLLSMSEQFGDKIYFLIDNYGEDLSSYAKEIDLICTAKNIKHELRNNCNEAHCGGWVDYGGFNERHTLKEAENLFARCAQRQKLNFCISVVNGIIYPCIRTRICIERKVLSEEKASDEWMDIFDETTSIEEQKKKLKSFYDLKVLQACKFCDGLCEDSKRYKPAEQLSW